MITLKNINLSSIDLSGIDLRGIKLGLGGRGGGSGDGFPQLPGDVTRWHFGGLTNEMMAAMDDPRIEDADHKGRFLSFKNFAWSGMSGAGGYNQNFNQWGYGNLPPALQTYTPHKMELNIPSTLRTGNVYSNLGKEGDIYDFTLKIVGLKDGASLRITKGVVSGNIERIEKDGIYKIYQPLETSWDQLRIYIVISNPNLVDLNITIEQLPLYPGALVFDGVDDCGVCDNFPILTKEKGYTVVALRSYLAESIGYLVYNGTSAKQSAFAFERSDSLDTWSWGKNSSIRNSLPKLMSYQTSNSYNNNPISTGEVVESNNIINVAYRGGYCNVAIWELVFLDHDATEEELTKIKDYFVKTYPWLFPDQAWTVTGKTNEDEDRATIANITGNGNDLVLSNFGFAEGSGHGLYAQNYISYAITNRAVYTKTNSSIHVTKSITAGVNFTESARNVTIPSYRIKVTGIQSGQEMIYRGGNNTFLTNIPSDGIYVLPAVENGSNLGFQFVSYTGDCDITIEQIPEYEGYLVTDGVDDKIDSSAFKMGEDFTVVGEWKLLPVSNYSYAGIIKTNNLYVYNNASIGISIYVCSSGVRNDMEGLKSLKAICSDGRVYGEDWTEYKLSIGRTKGAQSSLYLGYNSKAYTKMIFKNLGIYNNQTLSKDDCIKAYNYLQTLKAK